MRRPVDYGSGVKSGLPLVYNPNANTSSSQSVGTHHAGGTSADDEDIDVAFFGCAGGRHGYVLEWIKGLST